MSLPDVITRPTAGLYGPDGKAIRSVRDRRAPSPNQKAVLDGWVEWELVDRDGRSVRGGQQHNLILDSFLDWIGTNTVTGGAYSVESNVTMQITASHCAVGTGSTAPVVTDTALDAEVGRTATILSETVTRPANGQYEYVLQYEFDFAVGNGNLTEFAICRALTGGVLVRELFRDELGDPVTVTKTSDFKLRLTYTHTVTLTPVTLTTASLVITGIGTINGDVSWYGGLGTNEAADIFCFSRLARGSVAVQSSSGRNVFGVLSPTTISSYAQENSDYGSFDASSMTVDTYVGGSYSRTVTSATWGTDRSNSAGLRHIGIGKTAPASSNEQIGFSFRADDADVFTKDDLHILTVTDLVSISWARA